MLTYHSVYIYTQRRCSQRPRRASDPLRREERRVFGTSVYAQAHTHARVYFSLSCAVPPTPYNVTKGVFSLEGPLYCNDKRVLVRRGRVYMQTQANTHTHSRATDPL